MKIEFNPNPVPPLSSKDIEKHMNFDALLEEYNDAENPDIVPGRGEATPSDS